MCSVPITSTDIEIVSVPVVSNSVLTNTTAPTEGGAVMNDRGRKISLQARNLWIDIEKRISEIGKDFTSDMEVDHFTTQLGMYIGIQLGAEIGARLPTAAPTGGPNE
jgi:hypothetical protein